MQVDRQNFDGLSSCHLAVIADHLQLLHELMSAGGDPLRESVEGTPFQMAIDLDKYNALSYFLHMPSFLTTKKVVRKKITIDQFY